MSLHSVATLDNPLPRHGDNHLPFFIYAIKFIVYCVQKLCQRVLTSADWGEDDASESLNSCSHPNCRWVISFDRQGEVFQLNLQSESITDIPRS